MILIARKQREPPVYTFDYRRLCGPSPLLVDAQGILLKRDQATAQYLTPAFDRARLRAVPFTFSESLIDVLLEKLASKRNFTLNASLEVAQGVVPNPDVISKKALNLLPADRRRQFNVRSGQGVFVVPLDLLSNTTSKEREYLKPLFEPTDAARYTLIRTNSKQLIYSTRANSTARDFPLRLMSHLERFKEIMEARRENQLGRLEFFQLHWPRDQRFFARGGKILCVRKCQDPIFAYAEEEAYVMMAFNVIRSSRVNLLYLTALFNSKVVRFWLRHRGKRQGNHFQLDKEPILAIPLRVPNVNTQTRIAALVSQAAGLQRELANSQATEANQVAVERIFAQIDDRIQAEIQTVYELTAAESALVAQGD